MAKINISIDDELLERVDKQANSMYMSRSGFIQYACAQVLNSTQMMLAVQDLSLTMRRIADNGLIGDEERKELEDFERLVKMISGSK